MLKIRELRTKDTFALARILRKVGFKEVADLYKTLQAKSEDDDDAKKIQAGFLFVELLLTRLDDMEDELLAFFGDLAGMTAAEFAEAPLVDLRDILTQLVQKPEVASFFDSMRRAAT